MSAPSTLRNLSGLASTAQWMNKSSTLRRHCIREIKKTVSGFVGAYSMMAKYTGIDVKEEKDSLVNGCKWISIQSGGRLLI